VIRCVLALAAVLALSTRLPAAHAEPSAASPDIVSYEAEGEASSAAGGTEARTAALDDAFARAVAMAINDLVTEDGRTAHKGALDREIIGHARVWVVKFTVTKDEVTDDRRQLTVSVRIDRQKVRARLTELAIPLRDTPATTTAPEEPASTARTVTILLRLTSPTGVRADYGQTAEKDLPGVAAMTAYLRGGGFAVRRAPASGPAARATGELPVDDDEADALAGDAKADVALIGGVTVGATVPVRGVATSAALVTAHLKLMDRKDRKTIGQSTAVAAARGEDPGLVAYAIDRALDAAAADLIPPGPTKMTQAGSFHGEDTPIPETGIVLLRLPTKTPYQAVQAELKYLAGAKAVKAAAVRRLSPNGWVIGVTTQDSVEKIAAIARKSQGDTPAVVKIVDGIVDVTLAGAP
jgi:hypothetical protein